MFVYYLLSALLCLLSYYDTGVTSKVFTTGPSYNPFITFPVVYIEVGYDFPGKEEFGSMSPCTQTHTREECEVEACS